jgi:CarD family transcriptional regulator
MPSTKKTAKKHSGKTLSTSRRASAKPRAAIKRKGAGAKPAVKKTAKKAKSMAATATVAAGMTKKSHPARPAVGKASKAAERKEVRRETMVKGKAGSAKPSVAPKKKIAEAKSAAATAARAKSAKIEKQAGKAPASKAKAVSAGKSVIKESVVRRDKQTDKAKRSDQKANKKADKKILAETAVVAKTAAKILPAKAAVKVEAPRPAAPGGTPAKKPATPAKNPIPEASERNTVKMTKATPVLETEPAAKVATPSAASKPAESKKLPDGKSPSEKLAAVRAAAAKAAAAKAQAGKPAVPVPPPAKPALPPGMVKPMAPAAAKPPPTAAAPKPPAKPAGHRHGFKTNEFIVYPSHGVGQILAIEEQEVAGFSLELFIISFAKDKLTLKVPLPKVTSVGMRKLAEPDIVKRALDTLTGRARIKRTMWSRRAQEYEAKINSGDLVAIAEVVRDLYRSEAQPEQSYSERQLYEAALDRMAREIAAVQKLAETEALKLIESNLQKGPKRGAKVESEGDSDPDGPDDGPGDIEEAA